MVNILPAAPLGTTDQMSPDRAAVPIESVTASMFGAKRARRLATHPFGNKIGGTVFLALVGIATTIVGLSRL